MTYIVAEIGNNHEGSLDKAMALIDLAAGCGVDAVKFQMFRAEKLVHRSLPARVGDGTQLERMKRLEFEPFEWLALRGHAVDQGVAFFCSIFDPEFCDEAVVQDWPWIKIASGDAMNRPLIDACYATGKPLLLSMGLRGVLECNLGRYNRDRLCLMHCVSEYPTPPERAGLQRIRDIEGLGYAPGYSDHTCGITACLTAAAMGAVVIEKHFTDHHRHRRAATDSAAPKGDHIHAATPTGMSAIVDYCREIEKMTDKWYTPDRDARRLLERGAYAAQDIPKGQTIGEKDVIALRPRVKQHAWQVVGGRAQRDYKAGEAID